MGQIDPRTKALAERRDANEKAPTIEGRALHMWSFCGLPFEIDKPV